MKKDEFLPIIYRFVFYVLGMVTLALGIVLNAKVSLGVSPIISVAFVGSELLNIRFGDASFIWYVVFVFAEVIIRTCQKKYKQILSDVLQIPICLLFTRFMNLFTDSIPVFAERYPDSFPGSLAGRVIILLVAILLTGLGAAMVLTAKMIPNPGDGIVLAISEVIKKDTGFTKNVFDISCVILTFIIGIVTGNFLLGIGVGTVCAMILVGRVIWLYNKVTKKIELNKYLFPTNQNSLE